MAWQLVVPIGAIKELNGRCVIDATVEETVSGRSYPYHVEYEDPEHTTVAQMLEDVTNYAKEKASMGSAIDDLKKYEGRTYPLDIE